VWRASRKREGRSSYRAYNLSQDICPQFRRRPRITRSPPASSRSACLQIDLVRGGDSQQRVESLSVCAAYGQPAIRASTSRRSRCNPFLGASALSRASLRDDELEFPVFSSLTTFVLNRNTRRDSSASSRQALFVVSIEVSRGIASSICETDDL